MQSKECVQRNFVAILVSISACAAARQFIETLSSSTSKTGQPRW